MRVDALYSRATPTICSQKSFQRNAGSGPSTRIRSTSSLVTLQRLTVGHTMCRVESLFKRTCGRMVAKSVNSSGLISARGAAPKFSTRCFTAVLAASAASFQPVKAAMTWGRRSSGRRIHRTCSRSAIAHNATAQIGVRNELAHTTFDRNFRCF